MYAFQYANNYVTFQQSIDVWEVLILSLIHVDRRNLEKTLLSYINSKAHSSSHRKSIENYVNVKKSLEDAKFNYFLHNYSEN